MRASPCWSMIMNSDSGLSILCDPVTIVEASFPQAVALARGGRVQPGGIELPAATRLELPGGERVLPGEAAMTALLTQPRPGSDQNAPPTILVVEDEVIVRLGISDELRNGG